MGEFSFRVGDAEQHMVTFSFNKFWGPLQITVDRVPVVKDLRMFSFNLVKQYEFQVGVAEPHKVVIQKQRKLLFAGFQPQLCRVFIDGAPAGEYTV